MFGMRERSELSVKVNLSAQDAATAVLVVLQETPDLGTTWVDVQSVSVAAGTGTYSDFTASKPVSDVKVYEHRFTDLNADNMRIKISATSGAAGDVASVWARVK
jgi:hypothetical protein